MIIDIDYDLNVSSIANQTSSEISRTSLLPPASFWLVSFVAAVDVARMIQSIVMILISDNHYSTTKKHSHRRCLYLLFILFCYPSFAAILGYSFYCHLVSFSISFRQKKSKATLNKSCYHVPEKEDGDVKVHVTFPNAWHFAWIVCTHPAWAGQSGPET